MVMFVTSGLALPAPPTDLASSQWMLTELQFGQK